MSTVIITIKGFLLQFIGDLWLSSISNKVILCVCNIHTYIHETLILNLFYTLFFLSLSLYIYIYISNCNYHKELALKGLSTCKTFTLLNWLKCRSVSIKNLRNMWKSDLWLLIQFIPLYIYIYIYVYVCVCVCVWVWVCVCILCVYVIIYISHTKSILNPHIYVSMHV